MKCSSCLYENNCNLRNIAKDLTGCKGHSKIRNCKDNEVKCDCCGNWVDENNAFEYIDGIHYLCFDCY